MLINTWHRILEWFRDKSERNALIKNFNESSRVAFVDGFVPTLLKAKISKGNPDYKHQFSHWMYHGFRVEVFGGRPLSNQEIKTIGAVIMSDASLMRTLVVLGFDTLEVHGELDSYGCRWQIRDYLQLNQ